jgi:hypothetical protein
MYRRIRKQYSGSSFPKKFRTRNSGSTALLPAIGRIKDVGQDLAATNRYSSSKMNSSMFGLGIRIQDGKNDTHKKRKKLCFKVLDFFSGGLKYLFIKSFKGRV